ncbi:MAG: serine/threonine protein phosphatase [Sphingomonadales bacterium]|nr:serine/threonine protein phosphatase [Sphingomonadales bacterium]
MIARLFKSARTPARAPASVPAGRRVYAIGDIHGRHDLLIDLLGQIEDDDRSRGAAETTLIFLGDLIDRGPDSRKVIETVMALSDSEMDVRIIAGNHEEVFVQAASGDAKAAKFFTRIGGRETILSYPIDEADYLALEYDQLAERLLTLIPRDHVDFVAGFDDAITIGDYLFVHAGIMPGRPLDRQRTEDTRWIRDRFLDDERDHGKVVVHGHTISDDVEEFDNRIGIDTGAYCNGRLTAIGLEASKRWFLCAEGEVHEEWRNPGTRG